MGARLQGFRDDWRFQGTDRQIKSQIGNALPIMARAVGLAIYAALENVDFDYAQALKAPLRTPVPPAPIKRPTTGLRSKLPLRHFSHHRAVAERDFFGEVIRDYEHGELQERIVQPDGYRLKTGPEDQSKGETV